MVVVSTISKKSGFKKRRRNFFLLYLLLFIKQRKFSYTYETYIERSSFHEHSKEAIKNGPFELFPSQLQQQCCRFSFQKCYAKLADLQIGLFKGIRVFFEKCPTTWTGRGRLKRQVSS